MKDWFEEQKKAARVKEMREAEGAKRAFIKEIKSGLGKQITGELEQIQPPSKWQLFCKRLKRVLGL